MIVYNVNRRWFTMKADAETYRRAEGLPPPATATLRVETREDLAALLNELCQPGSAGPLAENVVPAAVVDRAYVPVDRDVPAFVPDFLLSDEQLRQRRQARAGRAL